MQAIEIRKKLFENQDEKYRLFQSKLIPTLNPDTIIGVRTPALKALAQQVVKDNPKDFLNDLPHDYFEENQLHAFIISSMKDFKEAIAEVERFLPYIDNWATCDQFSPIVFAKHKSELINHIKQWALSDDVYTCRFGIIMMMRHFLDSEFNREYLDIIAHIQSDEYYVKMAIAWYFATALAKQYDDTIIYINQQSLDTWIHNKTIQKACESRRINVNQKAYLKTLKIR